MPQLNFPRIEILNSAMEKIFGLKRKEITGKWGI
jgi:hypothetical protein